MQSPPLRAGHATPEVTREIYLHAIPEDQRRAVENVEKLLFGPKWTQVAEDWENGKRTINLKLKQLNGRGERI